MENVTARLSLSKMLVVRKGLFSIGSSVVIYEAQLTQKSLSNEVAFWCSAQQIHMTILNPLQNPQGQVFRPHAKFMVERHSIENHTTMVNDLFY